MKKLLSFVGTGDYVECKYKLNDKISPVVKHVQAALAGNVCADWSEDDSIILFCTEEAEKVNASGIEKEVGNLQNKIKEAPFRVLRVSVPDGKSEQELWEIFRTICDQIKPEDEIHFDLTHSFRSLPFLVFLVLNYVKVSKTCHIKGIYYGAFEVIGKPPDVKKEIPNPEERVAPIFELSPFSTLLDWTSATDKFLTTGDARELCTLTRREVGRQARESGGVPATKDYKSLAESLSRLTDELSTNRIYEISETCGRVKEFLDKARDVQDDSLAPLIGLLDRIDNKISNLYQNRDDEVRKGLSVVDWCLEHNLIQQALTVFQEIVITKIALDSNADYNDKDIRKIISKDIHKVFEEKTPEKFTIDRELANIYYALSEYRNDINHAGYRENRHKPEKFRRVVAEKVEKLRSYINSCLE